MDSEDKLMLYGMSILLGFLLLFGGGAAVFNFYETRNALLNGYEQVVDPATRAVLWKKVDNVSTGS